jgi:tripartite-type tricarboxylate transporter receptor subunit TctC
LLWYENMYKKQLVTYILINALLAGGAHAAALDEWPTKPVRVVIPYAPGGSSDLLGRLLAQKLADTFKQNFISDNRPGATGAIGSELVSKGNPDGYTLLISGVGSHVYAPAMTKLAYDGLNDFTHIALLGGPPGVLLVNSNSSVRDVAGLIAQAKAQPLVYGSAGTGSSGHLAIELFKQLAKIEMQHVPYKGAGPAVIDLRAGHIPVAVATLVAAAPQMKAGALRAVGITSEKRVKNFPDVPTFVESGFPTLVATTWFSLSGPPKMPTALTTRINQETRKAMRTGELSRRLGEEAIEANDLDPAQFTNFMRTEITRWAPVVRAAAAQAK